MDIGLDSRALGPSETGIQHGPWSSLGVGPAVSIDAVPAGGQNGNVSTGFNCRMITQMHYVQTDEVASPLVDEVMFEPLVNAAVLVNRTKNTRGAVEVSSSDHSKVSEAAPAPSLFVGSNPDPPGCEQGGVPSAVPKVSRQMSETMWQIINGCKNLLTTYRTAPGSANCIHAIIQAASQDVAPCATELLENKGNALQKSSTSEASFVPSHVGDSPSTADGQHSEDVEILDPGQLNRYTAGSVPGAFLQDKHMVAADGAFVQRFHAAASTSSRPDDDADSQVCQNGLLAPDELHHISGGVQRPVQAVDLSSKATPASMQTDLHTFPPERSDHALGIAEPRSSPLPATLDQLVQIVADRFRDDKDEPLTLRELLRTGDLKGQPVTFCKLGHSSISGVITVSGHIRCHCNQCKGLKDVSAREFKEHAGCHDPHPEAYIFMLNLNMTLKDFMELVEQDLSEADTHEVLCYVCHDGGNLLCCDGCPRVGHVLCVGLSDIPKGEWYCRRCQTGADTDDEQQSTLPSSPAEKETALSMSPTVPYVSPQGRVHMIAPSARSCGVRRERNTHKHKRLFEYGATGALQDGEKVIYRTTQGEDLLTGVVQISQDPNKPSGIVCGCCTQLISCSQFECHAGKGSRRAPYDNIVNSKGVTLRRVAELMPSTEGECEDRPTPFQFGRGRRKKASQAALEVPGSLEGILLRCTALVEDLEEVYGGCRICHSHDFQRNFGARTMLICEQCEQEYHVQCLKNMRGETYDRNPEEAWFCSKECTEILSKLSAAVDSGFIPLGGKYCMQLLHGSNGSPTVVGSLEEAAEILQESFDPIMDKASNQDLIPAMVHSEGLGEWDFHGVFTVLLFYEGMSVCAAVCRVFGTILVEVPLVATRAAARRQGHARVLMGGVEMFFSHLGVERLTLPAAPAALNTWIMGFDFKPMEDAELRRLTEDTKMLIFPGTRVLHKKLAAGICGIPHFLAADDSRRKPFVPQPESPLAEAGGTPLEGIAGTVPKRVTASGSDLPSSGVGSRGRGRGRGRGSRGRGCGSGRLRSLRHVIGVEGYCEQSGGSMAAPGLSQSLAYCESVGTEGLLGRPMDEMEVPATGSAGVGRARSMARNMSVADPEGVIFSLPDGAPRFAGIPVVDGDIQPYSMSRSHGRGRGRGRGSIRGRGGKSSGQGQVLTLFEGASTQQVVRGSDAGKGRGWQKRKHVSDRSVSMKRVMPATLAHPAEQEDVLGPPARDSTGEGVWPFSSGRGTTYEGPPQKRSKIVHVPSLSPENRTSGNLVPPQPLLEPLKAFSEHRTKLREVREQTTRDGLCMHPGEHTEDVSGDEFSFMKPAWPKAGIPVDRSDGVRYTGKRKQTSVARDPAKLTSALRASTSPNVPTGNGSALGPNAIKQQPSGITDWSKGCNVPVNLDPHRTPTPESELLGSGAAPQEVQNLEPIPAPEGTVVKRKRGRPKGSGVKKSHARGAISSQGGVRGRTVPPSLIPSGVGGSPAKQAGAGSDNGPVPCLTSGMDLEDGAH